MKQATKQRIVGTIVLLALGLIFLPIIFDGQGSYQPTVSSRIPDPPEVPILPEPEADRPQLQVDDRAMTAGTISPAEENANNDNAAAPPTQDDAEQSDAAAQEEVAVVESRPAFERELPLLDDNGLPQGWVVRLGTFANAANAENLVNRLMEGGYKAYTRSINSDQGAMTAVFVGPWLERSRVEQYQQELQEQFQLAGMIVRYEIESI